MSLLRIRLLGGFTLVHGDQTSLLTSSQLQAFVSYLLIHRDAPQHRQQLSFVFWPDSTEKQARTNLRHLLHRLRHEWPDVEQYVEIAHQTVGWRTDAEYELDVAQFEEELRCADQASDTEARARHLRIAVDWYHGEFLPGFYEDWVIQARARLERMFMAALEQLVLLAEQTGDVPDAIQYAERLLDREPFRETSYQALMRLHVANGDRGSALAVYHECVSQLRAELDVEPSAATQSLYRTLIMEGAGTELAPPLESVLVGRDEPWQRLVRLWRDVEAGSVPAQLVLIEGEAGIGKTRLAQELLDSTRRGGAVTAESQCYAGHADLSYAPLTRWLRSLPLGRISDVWLVELARLVPEILDGTSHLRPLGPMTEDWQRQRFFEALRHAATDHRTPVLLLLDDIQWCDGETLAWLSYLLQTGRRSRLLLVATLRGEEIVDNPAVAELITVLERTDQVTRIRLKRLNREEIGELASALLEQPVEPELVDELDKNTEGVPLFVVESLRSAGSKSDAAPIDTMPTKMHAVLLRRYDQLSHPAQHAASVAAAIGRAFSFEVLLPASELSEDALLSALDELWARQFLRESGRLRYDFAHDKLREVAYEALSPSRRSVLHRRIAQALEAVHEDDLEELSAQLAYHYEVAGEDERAAACYQRAAEVARRVYAQEEALGYLQRAIELQPAEPAHRMALGDVLIVLGRAADAIVVYGAARAQCAETPVQQARLLLKMGQAFMSQRNYPQAGAALDQAVQTLGRPTADDIEAWRLLLHIMIQQADYLYFTNQLEQLRETLGEVRELVALYGEARDEAEFYHKAAQLEVRQRRIVTAPIVIEYATKALAILEEIGDVQSATYARFGLGFYYLWANELDEAETSLTQALDAARRIGNAFIENLCLCYLTVTHRKAGRLREARETTQAALNLSTQLGIANYRGMAEANMAWLAYRSGQWAEAQRRARVAVDLLSEGDYPLQWPARLPLLAMALRDGDIEAAREQAHAVLIPPQQKLPDDLETAMQQAVDSVDVAEAERHLQAAISLAEKHHFL